MTPPVVHIGNTAGVPEQLCRGLRDQGWDAINVIPPTPLARMPSPVKALGLPLRWKQSRAIVRDAQARSAIIHTHYATSGLWFRGHHPLVVHAHGTDVRAIAGVRRSLLDSIFAQADAILAATPDLIEWLPNRAVFLPNPVDTHGFEFTPDLPDESRDVFVFAALNPIKGAEELLELVQLLRRQRPQTTVTAIAMGSLSDEFAAAGVKMVPFQTQAGLAKLLQGHKVVLGQRKLGILSVSEMQAMSIGRPVVLPLGDHPWGDLRPPVADLADVEESVEQILTWLEDPEDCKHFGRQSATWIRKHHSVESVAKRLTSVYQQIQ